MKINDMPKIENELWKSIAHFKGYEISNKGRVRSWVGWRGKFKRDIPKILKCFDNGIGYPCVRLKNKKTLRICILVLVAFFGKKHGNQVCRHIDSNKNNSNIENLEWSSYEQNYQDRRDLGMGNEGKKHGMYKHGRYSKYEDSRLS